MSLTRFALKFAVPAVKLEAYRRYLFIGPHPDDIEIGAGATAAKLAAEGKDVAFMICTDGRYGDGATALRGDELAEERKREAIASAKMLGVTDVRFIGLCDGAGYDVDELLRGIARTVGEFKPDVIFAPDQDVDSECHADHLNVSLSPSILWHSLSPNVTTLLSSITELMISTISSFFAMPTTASISGNSSSICF